MKRFSQSVFLAVFVALTATWTCAQNGPTQPQVVLTWTQSASPGVTKNCIYRGAASGQYTLPGVCIAAGTTYTDTTAQVSTTYFYAVTAQVGTSESQYSSPVQVVVPALPSPPSNVTAPTVTAKNEHPDATNLQARVQWTRRLQ